MRLELTRGIFRRRYQRFFADVEIPGIGAITAHCPNTGTMRTLLEDGADAWLRHSDDPKRKLAWTLVLLGVPGGLALVDTSLPNTIVAEGITAGLVPSLAGYETLRREAYLGGRSRFDMLLANPQDGSGRSCVIEVKNVTMRSAAVEGRADFPDAVTARGRKHLEELATLAGREMRAVQFYLLGRTDCTRVGIAAEIDPGYAQALETARVSGVEVIAVQLAIEEAAIEEAGGVSVALRTSGECSVEYPPRA